MEKEIRGGEGLPEISKHIYKETYFYKDETYDEWLERVSDSYSSNEEHKSRMKFYISNYWFHPATPISANAGRVRGFPISCFIREVHDSRHGIFYTWNEGAWLGSEGTGVGTNYENVREVNALIANGSKGSSSGVIPFLGVADRMSLAISQGSTRRSSECVYLDVKHPEIKEFIQIRKPDRDTNRAMPNLHHAVIISDEFMNAVLNRQEWNLTSRLDNSVVETVDAFDLWCQILDIRLRIKGEPFFFFKDNANKHKAKAYDILNLPVNMSNLCTEISLNTSYDKSNICCLGSLNLEFWDEISKELDQVVKDCLEFLDNVVEDFITLTQGKEHYKRAYKGAKEDRALGLGVMGLHTLYLKKGIPFGSLSAKYLNKDIFSKLKDSGDNYLENSTKEPCPTCMKAGLQHRNTTLFAIAPTMSIANLCNLTSNGVEPLLANYYSKKMKQSTFVIKNKFLDKFMREYFYQNVSEDNLECEEWLAKQWNIIRDSEGSVKKLSWMKDEDKDIFKTAFEINQFALIDQASDRQKYIDQSQSINLFFPASPSAKYVYDVHIEAWKKGLKSLYYLRSSSESRASMSANERKKINVEQNDSSCIYCE